MGLLAPEDLFPKGRMLLPEGTAMVLLKLEVDTATKSACSPQEHESTGKGGSYLSPAMIDLNFQWGKMSFCSTMEYE